MEPDSYFWFTPTWEKQQAPRQDRETACWPTRSCPARLSSPGTTGKRARRAVPEPVGNPSPRTVCQGDPGHGHPKVVRAYSLLQQSNFSYLKWALGQSNSLTAICSRCRATSAGGFTPQPPSTEQSCTGVILTRPVWTMWCYKTPPCISDAIQVICRSVENVKTCCQSGTPLLDPT